MNPSGTISAEYLKQQQELHENPHYGEASLSFAPLVKLVMQLGHLTSLSDYGAGKRNLKRRLDELGAAPFDYRPYDPAFPEYGVPRAADLVCCIDVLEHIEPERLQAVLIELQSITSKVGFFTIHTGPAVKVLSDGRNAHLIQRPASWWLPQLCERFEVRHMQALPRGFWVLVEPLGSPQSAIDPVRLTRLCGAATEAFPLKQPSRLARLARYALRLVVRR